MDFALFGVVVVYAAHIVAVSVVVSVFAYVCAEVLYV